MGFEQRKAEALRRLKRDLKEGKVDLKVLEILDLINSIPDFYSLSSCSGRICLLKFDKTFKKGEKKFVFKKHEKVRTSEIWEKLKELEGKEKNVMFVMEGAILHISSKNLSRALDFLKKVRNLGFKRGGIISIREYEVIMEIESTEKVCVPVILDSKLVITKKFLDQLVEISNLLLERTWKKLEKLGEYLESLK